MWDPLTAQQRSCEIPTEEQQQMHVPAVGDVPEKIINATDHPQFKEITAYANKLRKNSPGMKPERLKKKICEKFNIKLV